MAIPALIALMMFGYSDQAPLWLSGFTIASTQLGFPVLWLIKLMAP